VTRDLPADEDAEAAVLGAMLLGPSVGIDVIATVNGLGLRPGDFYVPRHQHVAAAVAAVHDRGDRVDPVLVLDELRHRGLLDAVGGIDTLRSFENATPSVTNVDKHAAVVLAHARRRRVIHLAGDLSTAALGCDDAKVALTVAELTIANTIATNGDIAGLPVRVDWDALFAREDPDTAWLVEDVWPAARQLHVFATRKTGKSLVLLYIAASLAAGRDPFTGKAQPRVPMTYVDYEMSEDDLLERLDDMGFIPAELELLSYYQLPTLPPLDTAAGGRALLAIAHRDQSVGVVIDTIGRAVEGDENAADTYHGFWQHTGSPLKRAGIGLARADHEGHEEGRSRGSSAKADDVDIVWRLSRTDDGYRLTKKHARISWIPDNVEIVQSVDPLTFRRSAGSWPAGTREKADELDAIAAPLGISKRQAIALLKAADLSVGRHEVLLKAIVFRQQEAVRGPQP
jgi:hypothetical protein